MILSQPLQEIIHHAIYLAVNELNHRYLTSEHLLFCALDDKSVIDLLLNFTVNIQQLRSKLYQFLQYDLQDLSIKNPTCDKLLTLKFTDNLVCILEKMAIHAQNIKNYLITPSDFLMELLLDQGSHASYFLAKSNLNPNEVAHYINGIKENFSSNNNSNNKKSNPIHNEKNFDFFSNDIYDLKEKKNSFLELYCINFNQKAFHNKIDPVFDREEEIELLLKALYCRRKGNALFVGESGVGKTAIIEFLACKIVNNDSDVPNKFKKAIIYSLDLNALISGTRYRGDLEERLKGLMTEIENSKQLIILFIDEIHTVIGTGSTNNGTLDIGNILKPYLARGVIYCIGATTRKEFTQFLSKDKAFLRRFQIININEPTEESAKKMIKGIIKHYANYHNVIYSDNSIEAAVKLSKRYIKEKQLPDIALDIIDFAGSSACLSREFSGKNTNIIITRKDIENVISSIANIPKKQLSNKEIGKLIDLEANLKNIIIGQNEAIKSVCSSILVNKAGLNGEDYIKPIASYIFYGPTGVGKTELAIQLAKLLNMNMIRIDMSEYSEIHSVAKLFGAPPGYVGFDQGGTLTEQVLKNPYSVILLDEIEKSHHSIHNSILQILDYGNLTDNFGQKVNFNHTIIICTTNSAANCMDKINLGFGKKGNNELIDREIENIFSPEFRNRFSAIIRFNHLDKNIIKTIIEKELEKIKETFKKKQINLEINDSVKAHIIDLSFNRAMGARPVERIINDKIKLKLANIFLGKEGKKNTIKEIMINFESNELSAIVI